MKFLFSRKTFPAGKIAPFLIASLTHEHLLIKLYHLFAVKRTQLFLHLQVRQLQVC